MGTKVETQENVNPPVTGNESVPEGGKVRPDKHKMQDPLKDTGQMDDDDDEDETFEDTDIDVKVVELPTPKADIEIDLVSLVSINKGPIEDFQMEDKEKLQHGKPCDYCDLISDNDPELKVHLSTAHDGLIYQYSQFEVTDTGKDTALKHVRETHVGM